MVSLWAVGWIVSLKFLVWALTCISSDSKIDMLHSYEGAESVAD